MYARILRDERRGFDMLTIANSGVRRTHRPTSFHAAVMATAQPKRSAAHAAAAAPSVDRSAI
ncbi:MAG: hypothetical protein U0R81_14560 [Mycobacterium sp.]